MIERPTPETDELISLREGFGATNYEWACHSRRLERERDEAREGATNYYAKIGELEQERDESLEKWKEQNEALRTLAEHGENEIQKLIKERDDAREALENHMAATIHTCHDECKRPMCVLRRERDEAREDLAHITKAAHAVVDRWEQPAWKDTEPTAKVIYRLRDALGREAE